MIILSQQLDFATRLFQKLVRFAAKPLGNADQTGQRKIVFAAFDAADECPVHVRALGERFLRQGHLFPIRAHVLCHSLAILDVHARQVWKKKAPENIDVTTIAFNTRQPPRTLAKPGLLFPKCHRKKSGRNEETCGRIFSGKMNAGHPTAGANGRDNF
jgi:hypothetical protein